MEFEDDVSLDTSQVEDLRGAGGIGSRVLFGGGGLGLVGLVIYFVLSQVGGISIGGPSSTGGVSSGQAVDNGTLSQECRTGRDANTNRDCALVAIINSIQAYWQDEFARSGVTYREAPTNFFTGGVRTGCGGATADVGPFYCPADSEVYVDLSFFEELKTRFGAQGGQFAEAYVLAHEYGHHVQNLLGTSNRVRTQQGPNSDAVRLELQADCYAGVWAHSVFDQLDDGDLKEAIRASEAVGDDRLQRRATGEVRPDSFTHGSSAQRARWFRTGQASGEPADCDTFAADEV
jgi:uncharacterized protein